MILNEILGILDALEANIIDGKRIPMTSKVILDEKYLLGILDKMRLIIDSKEDIVRDSVDVSHDITDTPTEVDYGDEDGNITQALEKDARHEAKEIVGGAHKYADEVLANLQLVVTKMQKNLITFEKNIESGRQVLDKKQQGDNSHET